MFQLQNTMKKLPVLVLVVGCLAFLAFSTANQKGTSKRPVTVVTEEPVRWMSFEEAVEKSKTERKKIFIDVYTDWCGWCKVMDRNTFNDPEVAKILNDKFYPVKLNAEQRADINFDGHTFKFIESGSSGYHELAAALLGNKLSFPTVVFLTEDFKMIQPLAGYVKADEFHKIIKFIGYDYFKSKSWDDFQKSYKSPYAAN